jgi:hypothetical protein
MLLDVTPEGEHLAGSIEHMLEDAGLLDALVVLPEHTTATDILLSTTGLSDCRLDLAHQTAVQVNPQFPPWGAGLLRSDLALSEIVGEQVVSWEALTQTLLPMLEYTLFSSLDASSQSIQWRHGLLAGRAGTGSARCLGKATRLREQQQAMAQLYQHWKDLERQLQTLNHQIEQLEQQRQTVESIQNQLDEIWKTSGVENQYTQLKTALSALQQTNENYRQHHQASLDIRLHVAALRRTLQQDTTEVPLFTTSSEKVEQAANATRRLASEQQTLQNYLEQLRSAWQEYHRAQDQLHKDKAAEWRADEARRNASLEERSRVSGGLSSLLERQGSTGGRVMKTPQETTAALQRAVAFFQQPVWLRLLDAIYHKYMAQGNVQGRVHLQNCTAEEQHAIIAATSTSRDYGLPLIC